MLHESRGRNGIVYGGARGAASAGAALTCDEQERLLDRVSRTFALTIPKLPPPLRLTVGNAYLLCRIIDTIEDEPTLTPEHKRRLSERFVAVVAGQADAVDFAERLGGCLSDRTSHWERVLVEATPRVIALTRGFAPVPRAAIERCVRIMAPGMSAFQERRPTRGLADLAEMERYCYVVAGVVGEMLTDLFCDHCPEIAPRAPELRLLAVRFGQGLQMTNILKDIWDDAARSVCWLPRCVFDRHGVDLATLSAEGGRPEMAGGVEELVAIAHAQLAAALDFVLMIPPRERGIRIFCLWAIGMALLTLRRIRARPDFRDAREVKISRHSVRATALACRVAAGNDGLLRLLFQAAGPAGGRTATVR
jgi:farnesyl-diphosphate farnesyltransferase